MEKRIEKIRTKFQDFGISKFMVLQEEVYPAFIRYLTGFKGEGLLIIDESNSFFITDSRYEIEAKRVIKNGEVIIARKKYLVEALELGLIKPGEKIGFEAEMPHRSFLAMKKLLFRNKLVPLMGLIEQISSQKDEGEIKKIKKVLKITEHIFEKHILPGIKSGIKETDLAAEIIYQGILHGAEDKAFEPTVASGWRSAFPHGGAFDKKIKAGEIIQFDFGHMYQGYCSDFSRVVIVGEKATEEQKKIHKILAVAQSLAIKKARAGMKAKDLDKVARDYIENKGYGQCFNHTLGHGIGILLHTKPSVAWYSEEILLPGQIVTIEPGIYSPIPGFGGMRVEDMILIQENGCQRLNKFPADLIITG